MFHIGQQVVCIDDPNPDVPMSGLYRGGVYTISEIFSARARRGIVVQFQFEELQWNGNAKYIHGFWSGSFRPVKKTSIEIFTKLLAPTPELVS